MVAACSQGTDPEPQERRLADPVVLQACAEPLNEPPLATRRNETIPPANKPAKGWAFSDPRFGSCVTRITDHLAEPPAEFARNDYSRRQAFNADNTRLLVYGRGGTWHLYDPENSAYLQSLPALIGDAEPQWSPSNPDELFFLPEKGLGMQVFRLSVSTGQVNLVGDLSVRLSSIWPTAAVAWTRSEGSPSRDARFWAFLVETVDAQPLGLVVWDAWTDQILASRALSDAPDYASMSPSGEHVVVAWENRTIVYSARLDNPRRLASTAEHSDIARGFNGEDYFVSIDFGSRRGEVFMTHLASGRRTRLFDTYADSTKTSVHVSGKAFDRPGWVVVSTYDRSGDVVRWHHEKILLVALEASPRIYPLAHHRSRYLGYWTEPHASVNRDLSQVVYNSNWQANSALDVDLYRVRVPATVTESNNGGP